MWDATVSTMALFLLLSGASLFKRARLNFKSTRYTRKNVIATIIVAVVLALVAVGLLVVLVDALP